MNTELLALREQLAEAQQQLANANADLRAVRSEYATALGGIETLMGATGHDDALSRSLELARLMLGADAAFLIVDQDGERGTLRATTDSRWQVGTSWPWTGVFKRTRRGRTVTVFDAHEAPGLKGRPARERQGLRACLLVPIHSAGADGVLVVTHPEVGAFGRADVARARPIAPIIERTLDSAHQWEARLARQTSRMIRTEAALASSDQRTQTLLQSMREGVVMETGAGHVVLANDAFRDMMRLEGRDLLPGADGFHVARTAAALFEESDDFLFRYGQVIASGAPSRDEIKLLDGRIIEVTSELLPDPIGASGRIWIYRDVTARVRDAQKLAAARDAAEQANYAKNDFLASISHEIRTPLNAIIGMTELVMDTHLTPEQEDLVRTVRGASAQLHHLLSDLLDFSKIESGDLSIASDPYDPGRLAEDVVEGLGPQATQRGLALHVRIAADIGRMWGDAGRVRQVINNLVANALKFTEEGSVTVLVARDADDGLAVSVTDTGPGIDPAKQLEVFGRYAQGEATHGPSRGVGLGLHISQTLVEAMGGRIGVRSQKGHGSTFYFHLPGPVEPPSNRPLAGLHLVVMADDPELVESASAQARALGMTVAPDTPCGSEPGSTVMLVPTDWPEPARQAARSAGQQLLAWAAHGTAVSGGFDGHVRLPITRDALRRVISGTNPTRRSAPLQSGKLLLADDDPNNRRVFCTYLERAGFEVVTVTDGREALEAAADPDLDLILMDIQMPVMDGLSATRAILSRHRDAPPIVALTAHATPVMRRASLDAGMADFVTKPIGAEDLVQTVRRHLSAGPVALLADDDPAMRKMMRMQLQRVDPTLRITAVAHGGEAVEVFEELGPDMVLLDVEMPVLDGRSAVRRLREMEWASGRAPARIIAVTGHHQKQTHAGLRELGFDEVWTKPLSRDDLERLYPTARAVPPTPAEPVPGNVVTVRLDPLLAEMAPEYLSDVKEAAAHMQAALSEGLEAARPVVEVLAHRFKGTGAAFGFPDITDLCQGIENSLHKGNHTDAVARVDALLTFTDRVLVLPHSDVA